MKIYRFNVLFSEAMSRAIKFTFNNKEFEMSKREKLFAMEYIKLGCSSASQAAVNAGYPEKNRNDIAFELTRKPSIKAFIEEMQKDMFDCLQISALTIAKEYAKIGFANIRNVFDEHGNLIKVKEIDVDHAAAISSVEVFEEYQGSGENRVSVGKTKKVKFHDKINGLDKLAKMLGVDGVTKIAQTDSKGNDAIVILPKKEI